MDNDNKSVFRMFKFVGGGFILYAVFSLAVSLAVMGGLGYAIYWGLSIAERAVEQGDSHQVEQP